jgi:uncharacterized membrane protein
MRMKNLDLFASIAVIAMNVLWALLPSHLPIIGIILALPLVFLLPGYTLIEAFFYKVSINYTYLLALSIGLSLIIDILSGFILNMFPVGLRAMSWVIFLGVLIVVLSLLVALHRRGYSKVELSFTWFRLAIYEYLLIGLSIVIVILSIQYSVITVKQQPHLAFTQLWMLPSTPVDRICTVRLGVQNFEETSMKYRITMTANGVQVNTWALVVLTPQEKWDRSVTIPSTSTNSIYIEAKVYKSDESAVIYREVHLTLNSSKVTKDQKAHC